MPLAQGPDVEYRFNDVRVDTRAHSVTRGGVELALEPKAYGVLLQLLARPGAVFARDDLLDAVWGHRHVTPAVLNRVIAMLRRELGDDADHPTTIRTVHGVGYSLIAAVTAAPAAETTAAAAEVPAAVRELPVEEHAKADINSVPAHDEAVQSDSGRVPASGEVVAPAAVLANNTATSPAALPHASAVSPRNPRVVVIAAIAAIVVAIVLAWSQGPASRQRMPAQVTVSAKARGSATQPVTLAVLPFTSVGGDDKLRELAIGLTDSFGEALARVAGVRVTASESTSVAAAASREPQAVARALSVEHVLGGRLRAVDPATFELKLTLHTPEDPEPKWSHVVRHARAQPYRMLGPALDAIASSPVGAVRNARQDASFDASLDGQDLYWLGRQHLARRDFDSWRRARKLFERAVEIDPGYALAWTSISESHRYLAIAGEQPLQVSVEAALTAVDRALALDPNLTEAYIEKSLISTLQWRAIEGRAAAQRALELAPNNPTVVGINANIENYLGRPRAAYALHKRAHAASPLSGIGLWLMGNDCAMLGDEACARARYGEARRLSEHGRLANEAHRRLDLMYGTLWRTAAAATSGGPLNTPYDVLACAQALSMLGFDRQAAEALAQLKAQASLVPLHLAVRLDRHWRTSSWKEALRAAEGAAGDATQEPWRTVWRAQARVLAGDTDAGLRDYDRALADKANRALVTHSWFPTRIGIGQIANWIALRRRADASYQSELAALNADIAAMVDGGVDFPAFDYHRAVAAALAGDTTTADQRIGRAIERGWLDDVAFETDFVWRDFAEAPWLQARREQIRSRLTEERALALAAMPAAK